MTYFFHIAVFLVLLILKTTIMPCFWWFDGFYDLLAPFVIYLGLFRSLRESIPVILVLGLVMDNLSGGPWGLYLTTYIWLFAGVQWMITVLHVGDSVLMPIVVALGVLIQNLIFIGTLAMAAPGQGLSSTAFNTVGVQVLWALLTGPVFLILLRYLHQTWEGWTKEVLGARAGD